MRFTVLCAFGARVLACLLWIGSNALTAQATIPLVLKETIQLLPGGPWDIQHIMDDSTYGWARVSGEIISYKRTESDFVHSVTIPAGIWGRGGAAWHDDRMLRLLRMSTADDHLCVVLYARVPPIYDPFDCSDAMALGFLDLETETCVDTIFMQGNCFFDQEGAWSNRTTAINQIYPWPPPPAVSNALLFSSTNNQDSYIPGENYYTDWSGYGTMVDFADSMQQTDLGPWDNMQPFGLSAEPAFALSGSSGESYHHDGEYPGEETRSCYVGRYVNGTVLRDTLLGCRTAAAQVDADGTRRLIYGNMALDPETFAPLWTNPDISTGVVYTARLPGNHNERLLVEHDHIFQVYDATDGSFMDWTSAFWGDWWVMIRKRQSLPSEILTYDQAQMLIRVYEAALPPAHGLTISYIPETGSIRLHWPRVTVGTGYNIYASDSAMGTYLLLAHVSAPAVTFDLPPTEHIRFFSITDTYDNP